MKQIQAFNFEDTQVRTILLDETPWFVGKDVATILGYARPQKAVQDHVEKEDKREDIVNLSQASQNGTRPQLTLLVNESGVYDLIFNSKLPTGCFVTRRSSGRLETRMYCTRSIKVTVGHTRSQERSRLTMVRKSRSRWNGLKRAISACMNC